MQVRAKASEGLSLWEISTWLLDEHDICAGRNAVDRVLKRGLLPRRPKNRRLTTCWDDAVEIRNDLKQLFAEVREDDS